MKHSHVTVLNLEYSTGPTRDRIMSTLVSNYLRFQGVDVVEAAIWKGFKLLAATRPTILLQASSIGDRLNHEVMRFAVEHGVTGVTLTSEGNYRDDKDPTPFVWGWNKEQILLERLRCLWSERSKKLSLSVHPEIRPNLAVTGASGFDMYQIRPKTADKSLLAKYGKDSFKKVVGIACWNFGGFYPQDHMFSYFESIHSPEVCERFRQDGKDFGRILCALIDKNPDILFLVKEHPTRQQGDLSSGIEGVRERPNVLVIHLEEGILDCIDTADVWISYESTTDMEAWLRDTQTLLLNPSGREFDRGKVHLGSPCFTDSSSLHDAIQHYYTHGNVASFNEREAERKKIIEDAIQWDDGLNHVRAGNAILDLLDELKKENAPEPTFPVWPSYYRFREFVAWHLSRLFPFPKKLERYKRHSSQFNEDEIASYGAAQMDLQKAFYEKNGLSKEALRDIRGL